MAEAFASPPLSEVEAVAFGDLFPEDVRAYREERLTATGRHGAFPTPSSMQARSSPSRSPLTQARSSSATASSSAT